MKDGGTAIEAQSFNNRAVDIELNAAIMLHAIDGIDRPPCVSPRGSTYELGMLI